MQTDAEQVGDKIKELVATLGLTQTLSENGIDRDQTPIIVSRAIGGVTEGPLYDSVTRLVEKLY